MRAGTSRGQADGFNIEFLSKITGTKGKSPGNNLMKVTLAMLSTIAMTHVLINLLSFVTVEFDANSTRALN